MFCDAWYYHDDICCSKSRDKVHPITASYLLRFLLAIGGKSQAAGNQSSDGQKIERGTAFCVNWQASWIVINAMKLPVCLIFLWSSSLAHHSQRFHLPAPFTCQRVGTNRNEQCEDDTDSDESDEKDFRKEKTCPPRNQLFSELELDLRKLTKMSQWLQCAASEALEGQDINRLPNGNRLQRRTWKFRAFKAYQL
jgi:hypothetical protein